MFEAVIKLLICQSGDAETRQLLAHGDLGSILTWVMSCGRFHKLLRLVLKVSQQTFVSYIKSWNGLI